LGPEIVNAGTPVSHCEAPSKTSCNMTAESMHCRRCGKDTPPLNKAPFRNELGDRVLAEICPSCWQDWLQHQTLLINHYGLDPREPKAREFLYEQICMNRLSTSYYRVARAKR